MPKARNLEAVREAKGEGQGEDAGDPDDIDLPALLTADLPEGDASMMAAE